jgi:hypothetical protein
VTSVVDKGFASGIRTSLLVSMFGSLHEHISPSLSAYSYITP